MKRAAPLNHLSPHAQSPLRSDFFNIFNRVQYGPPLAELYALLAFGQTLSTVNPGPVGTGASRQIQFLVRLEF